MRRLFLAVALMLVATATMAQTQVSVFTSDLGYILSSGHYSERTGGFGLALSHALTPHWGLELKIADEKHYGGSVVWTDPAATPSVTYRTFHATPMDLLGQYRFPNSSRWTPYLSAGVHYVSAPNLNDTFWYRDQEGNVHTYQRKSVGSRAAGEVGVGTSLRITPHFGLRFDANVLVAPGRYYDDLFRPSLGLSWRF